MTDKPNMTEPPTVITVDPSDPRILIDVLVQVVKFTAEDGARPVIEVAGKRYQEYELVKLVSALLKERYDEEMTPHHQALVDPLFRKRQHGYGRTAYNLANRANAIAARRRA